MIDDSKSYYVNSVLWANLASEVYEIREMLEPEEEEAEEEEQLMPSKASHSGPLSSNAALFGFRALAHSLHTYHPSLSQAVNLFAIFIENVSPQVHLFHAPTLSRVYWDSIASLDSLDKNVEALLFAIYYSAVISAEDGEITNLLGMTRVAALDRYRFAVEQAMARADLLNTQSMMLLQAVVLFLSALRSQDTSRTPWSLTTLVFHIAQTMGIHRDGTAFGLKPFETEMRRRLWWYICILDSRSSENHGFQPIVHQFSSDTKFPLHVNDTDLTPDMRDFPPERKEPTDVTLLLLRCEALSTAWKVGLASPGLPSLLFPSSPSRAGVPDGAGVGIMSLKERKAIIREMEERLKEKYIGGCDESIPLLIVYRMIADLIVKHFILLVHHITPGSTFPRSGEAGLTPASISQSDSSSSKTSGSPLAPAGPRPNVPVVDDELSGDRDLVFYTSIDALELSVKVMCTPSLRKWAWYAKPHIQWHAVAFLLAEICSRPPSAECDRAWEAVCGIYEVKGSMWRPIKRLMAKARYVREMQARSELGGAGGGNVSAGSVMTAGAPPLADLASTGGSSPTATSWSPILTAGSASGVHDMGYPGLYQNVLGAGADDSFMELLDLADDDMHTDEISTFGLSGIPGGFSLGMMGAGSAMDGWDGRMW